MNQISPTNDPSYYPNLEDETIVRPLAASQGNQTDEEVSAAASSIEDQIKAKLEEFFTFWSEQPVADSNVMNRVLALLIEMTTTIQKTATSQAANLSFLTRLQNAYIQLQQQIPVISKDLKWTGGNKEAWIKDKDIRGDVNQTYTNYMDIVRANKSMIEGDAKQVQAQLNASKEAGTQFSDFLSSLLTQLQNLTGALYR